MKALLAELVRLINAVLPYLAGFFSGFMTAENKIQQVENVELMRRAEKIKEAYEQYEAAKRMPADVVTARLRKAKLPAKR